jgi:hypothetical protein
LHALGRWLQNGDQVQSTVENVPPHSIADRNQASHLWSPFDAVVVYAPKRNASYQPLHHRRTSVDQQVSYIQTYRVQTGISTALPRVVCATRLPSPTCSNPIYRGSAPQSVKGSQGITLERFDIGNVAKEDKQLSVKRVQLAQIAGD